MNKIVEGKLKNFPEIETWIVISCPFSSYFDSEEFKNLLIINPIELYLS